MSKVKSQKKSKEVKGQKSRVKTVTEWHSDIDAVQAQVQDQVQV